MTNLPYRFEEIALNFGFVPVDIRACRGYYVVYNLFKEIMDQEASLILIKGNEEIIQLKEIEGPVKERERYTIYSQDIKGFYQFNFKNKLIGFSIQANRKSKTGYWFLCFEREGQLLAFRDFLGWIVTGKLPITMKPQNNYFNPNLDGRCHVRRQQSTPRARYRSVEDKRRNVSRRKMYQSKDDSPIYVKKYYYM